VEAHSFGRWLRLKRKALDLTREALAQRVGCSAATIQKLEEEERRPSIQMAERMAVILDVPTHEQAAFVRFARGQGGPRPRGLPKTSRGGGLPRQPAPIYPRR
jgi:transcriptional regulator with XRE-family HTH domain